MTPDRPLPPFPFAPDTSTAFGFRFTPDDLRQGYSVQCDECNNEFGFVSYAWCHEAYADSETPLWLMPPHAC